MPVTFVAAGTAAANAANATTLNVPYPAGLAAGDVLVLCLAINSTTVSTVPTGFTSQVSTNASATTPQIRILTKYATGSESGSLAVTTANVTSQGRLLAFRGADQTTLLDTTATILQRGAANLTFPLPSQTTTAAGAALIAVASQNGNTGTWSPPTEIAGWVESHDVASPTPKMFASYLLWSGSGATGVQTVTSSTSLRGAAGMIALRPASGPTTYPAEGSTPVVSTTSASATVRAVAAGTVAAVALTTGAATARLAASGITAAVSTVSGSAEILSGPQRYPAAGTVPVISTTSGAAILRAATSGTVAATSTTTGAATVLSPASGTVTAVTATTGSATARLAAAGTSNVVSTTTGQAISLRPTSGTVAAVSTTSGSASVAAGPQQYPAAGTVAATSATTGAATLRAATSGTVAAESATSADATLQAATAGTVTVTSATSGSATVIPGGPTTLPELTVERVPDPLSATRRPDRFAVTRVGTDLAAKPLPAPITARRLT